MKEMAALILAGGQSSRMGTNKALLSYKGKSFLQNIIDQVKPLGIPLYLSGNDACLFGQGLLVLKDNQPHQGPVVAMASSMDKIQAKNTLVLSCDIPQVTTNQIERLIEKHSPEVDVTMFRSDDKDLPLVAVYSSTALPYFLDAMNRRERKLLNVIKQMKTKHITYQGVLKNVNTPQDLELIK